ncbi:uncharacterized protein LOC110258280 [Sus scrofa]|uniref:uncharacterized protein LOC110258280 n=1 Tax=Sus scrofa TaxID=9823 RepID=UPI000A2AFBF4|nr:uncharacterized protein LOC110258280 [Sus scrofa]
MSTVNNRNNFQVSRYRLTLRREEGGPQQPDDSHLLTQGSSALLCPPHVQVDSTLVTWPCGNQAAAVKSRHFPGCCFGWNVLNYACARRGVPHLFPASLWSARSNQRFRTRCCLIRYPRASGEVGLTPVFLSPGLAALGGTPVLAANLGVSAFCFPARRRANQPDSGPPRLGLLGTRYTFLSAKTMAALPKSPRMLRLAGSFGQHGYQVGCPSVSEHVSALLLCLQRSIQLYGWTTGG